MLFSTSGVVGQGRITVCGARRDEAVMPRCTVCHCADPKGNGQKLRDISRENPHAAGVAKSADIFDAEVVGNPKFKHTSVVKDEDIKLSKMSAVLLAADACMRRTSDRRYESLTRDFTRLVGSLNYTTLNAQWTGKLKETRKNEGRLRVLREFDKAQMAVCENQQAGWCEQGMHSTSPL